MSRSSMANKYCSIVLILVCAISTFVHLQYATIPSSPFFQDRQQQRDDTSTPATLLLVVATSPNDDGDDAKYDLLQEVRTATRGTEKLVVTLEDKHRSKHQGGGGRGRGGKNALEVFSTAILTQQQDEQQRNNNNNNKNDTTLLKYLLPEIIEENTSRSKLSNKNNITTTILFLNSTTYTQRKKRPRPKVDFGVIGFPKCGTTSLLELFENHNDTTIHSDEKCYKKGTEEQVKKLFAELDELPTRSNATLRGFKCPTSIVNIDWLWKLKEYSEGTKFIIGIRHPVHWFESFYNFRVRKYHEYQSMNVSWYPYPPDPATLMRKDKKFVEFNTDTTRYEYSLMQLGKTDLSASDISALGQRNMRVFMSPAPILIYVEEMLGDDIQEEYFRSKLQSFLELEHPFQKVPKSNSAQASPLNNAKEIINICDEKHKIVRNQLVTNGRHTANWILNHFVKSSDVIIGGDAEYFRRVVESFAIDPCQRKNYTNSNPSNTSMNQ
jgi:hypothetical protein